MSIYKGDSPLSFLHLFTSVLTFLSNSCSTMSKYPFWQAIYKGDAPLSFLHLFTSVLTFLSNSCSTDKKVNTDVNQCIDNGASPLYIACQKGHLDIVLQLLDKKVNTDVNKCRKDSGASPLLSCLIVVVQCLNVLPGKQYIKVIHHCLYTDLHLY
jgi:hypothetical protein